MSCKYFFNEVSKKSEKTY